MSAYIEHPQYLISLEGGGTRSQAALMDLQGNLLQTSESSDVNTNFVSLQQAREAVLSVVSAVLQAQGNCGESVRWFISALVGPRFGPELFSALIPHARFRYYSESDVVFARAGLYRPHGVAVVAATGATAWGVRRDAQEKAFFGGWGSLLGDEGSAYAVGLSGLRAAARAYEGRERQPTGLVQALCEQLGFHHQDFRADLVRLAYQKPLSRAEIAGLARVVTRLAKDGDAVASGIVAQAAEDLTSLALHAARRLFRADEVFDVAAAGGLFNAGEMILAPLCQGLQIEFPQSRLILGSEMPAVALGRLALYNLEEQKAC